MKLCRRCDSEKGETDFPINAHRADGRSNWCKKCHASYVADRRQTRPKVSLAERRDARREASRQWHIVRVLPWEVWVDDRRVALFRDERDARGFAKARYGDAATVDRFGDVPAQETEEPDHDAAVVPVLANSRAGSTRV